MRTTLTLDDDVARLIADAVHRDRRTMKEVVNTALRRGLLPDAERAKGEAEVPVHSSPVCGGLDSARLNQLADEVDDDASIAAMS
ncbi:MAG: antitoxin [Acidimicrobiia bacterium]|jgi:hypothetical protein|nr:antitoxin [Acidimicrobiia bacterium]